MFAITEETMEVKTHGLAHFKKMTNWMDIVVIAVMKLKILPPLLKSNVNFFYILTRQISAVQIALNVYMTILTPSKLAPLLEKPFRYPDFSGLAKM